MVSSIALTLTLTLTLTLALTLTQVRSGWWDTSDVSLDQFESKGNLTL